MLGHTSLVPRPRLFSFFGLRSASVYYIERKPKNENRGGLGTRLRLCQSNVVSGQMTFQGGSLDRLGHTVSRCEMVWWTKSNFLCLSVRLRPYQSNVVSGQMTFQGGSVDRLGHTVSRCEMVWWAKSNFLGLSALLQQCNLATFKIFCTKPAQERYGYSSKFYCGKGSAL